MVGRWLFVTTVLGAVLALGSLDTIVLCVVVGALAVSVCLVWSDASPFVSRRVATLLLATACGLTLYTLLQSVPLPASMIAAIAPHNADVWSRALAPLHEPGPSWHPLSLDPTATRCEVLRGTAYVLAFLAAVRIARHRAGVAFVTRALVVCGLIVAIAAIAHPVGGVDKVYGLYKPKTDVGAIAPLLNTNHLAGYVNIGTMLAFASVLSPNPFAPRALVAALVLLLASMEVWLASRGGVATMCLGFTLVLAQRFASSRVSVVKRSWILGGVCVLAGIGMFILGAFESSFSSLKDTDVSKLSVDVMCFQRMAPAYPLFGAGRGAFESTFPEFRTGVGFVVFSHPENLFSQWVTEWGAPVAIIAFATLVFALGPRVAHARGESSVGAWTALVVLAAHNLVDFSLEVPGVVLSLVTCAAIVSAGGADPAQRVSTVDRWGSRPRAIMGISLAAATAAIVLAWGGRQHELLDERARLRVVARDSSISDLDVHEQLRAAMLAHPAEPYFPYLGGARALVTGRESVMPWLERTLERAPVYGPAHLVLARSLRRISPSQSRLEYRLATEQGASYAPEESIALVRSFDDARELAPDGTAGVPTLDAIARAVASSLPATRWRIDQELLGRGGAAITQVDERLARDALADVEAGAAAPWCDDGSCPAVALAAADREEISNPMSTTGFMVRARVMAIQGDPAAGLAHLRRACDTGVERAPCLVSLAELAIDLHRDAEASRAIDELARSACTDDSTCVSLQLTAAGLEDGRGNPGRALVFVRRAVQLAPERADVLESVAVRSSQLGLHADALDAYERLAREHPENATYAAGAEKERTLGGPR